MNSSSQNPTMVLVHGAWADGSSWSEVILRLERQAFKVICVPIPLTSLSDDVSALTRALERTTGPLVLAGHAYAGGVIGAIHDERVKALVYIAALAPTRPRPSRGSFIATNLIPKHRSWSQMDTNLYGCRKTASKTLLRNMRPQNKSQFQRLSKDPSR